MTGPMRRLAGLIALVLMSAPFSLGAQTTGEAKQYGPYNADIIAAAPALIKPLDGHVVGARPTGQFARPAKVDELPAGKPWTMSAWVRIGNAAGDSGQVAGIGDAEGKSGRYLGLVNGSPALWAGDRVMMTMEASARDGKWHLLAASYDGTAAHLYFDGKAVATSPPLSSPAVAAQAVLGPRPAKAGEPVFAGQIASFTEREEALDDAAIRALAAAPPDFALVPFEAASGTWQVSTRQMMGQLAPQDAWTLPKSKAPFDKPVAKPVTPGPALAPLDEASWRLGQWKLIEVPRVSADGAALSRADYDASVWYAATVPGTVLTTLVDRGVYPDPAHGLNNLAIPETLNKQDYWYRTTFDLPADHAGQRFTIRFNGVNYASEVWLNGKRIGTTRGAFTRGIFDVTDGLRPGTNALAVKVSPPPHPGIAQEASIAAGPGENGGMQALDGPTFIATEGWDWIPSVRDRNTGIWQDVVLHATGPVSIGDAAVVTTLPLPDTSRADIEIDVPLANHGTAPLAMTLDAGFDDVRVSKAVTLAPGETTVRLTSAEFPQLVVRNPALWWPNGYGEPNLHVLRLVAATGGAASDAKDVRFGMRELSYEISLVDSGGMLRRVDYRPTLARAEGKQVVDVRHEAIRHVTGGYSAWAASTVPGADDSPALARVPDSGVAPSLILKVNGVRIAARGGNWGMDDWMKRVSRDRLEPYFRLTRDAHLNIIRNWQGQNTEAAFYDLADEYGLLIVNDFWESTQGYNLEASDTQLFLDNAADVIRRFRNHPSIAIWIGRNEGVPQPAINEGLEKLARELDGTRHYSGASNFVNFGLGGPYAHQDPDFYFTYPFGNGFSMELGLPSFPTLEAFKAMIPEADRWPISDDWAYHDWHQAGNGDTHSFLKDMTERFGAPSDLADFERKAQLLNYEDHRAAFEGFNAGLWTKTSGRLLWMSQPAWPSMVWQIYSSDYDPNASYFGVKTAAEPVHAQLDLPGNEPAVVNNLTAPLAGATLRVRILGLDGTTLWERKDVVDVPAGAVKTFDSIPLTAQLAAKGAVLVRLDLAGADGATLSSNLYWRTKDKADGKQLADLPPQPVSLSTRTARGGGDLKISATVRNTGDKAVLDARLTLEGPDGERILPAYYSDNYLMLLPGEARTIEIDVPGKALLRAPRLRIGGWDVKPADIALERAR